MIKNQLKNTALNWPFQDKDYKEFTDNIWPRIDPIPGYLSKIEAFFLYMTAKNLRSDTRQVDQPKADSVVEIGSYKGRSTTAIGLGLKENTNARFSLVCVDPFFDESFEKGLKNEFIKNISASGLNDMVTLVSDYSSEAVKKWPFNKGIAMLWIDGNHEYEYVRNDFLLWSRFLVPGGVVAFHDWYLIGVKDTIIEYLFTSDSYQNLSVIDWNIVASRKLDGSPSSEQRANKKKIFWALRTGSTSPFIALAAMIYDLINRPFGNLRLFLKNRVNIQKV
ncbi:MAG: class I SAM-dependent methyltransferase [Nitrospirota bacterium]|nr:class I SAM-dependent methyltransferase [Nitrospirota bacterium]